MYDWMAFMHVENVGRQGDQNFPLGIDIITLADYFSLGNRTASYLDIAPQIAQMNEMYWNTFVVHLQKVKICHWDIEVGGPCNVHVVSISCVIMIKCKSRRRNSGVLSSQTGKPIVICRRGVVIHSVPYF